MNTQLTSFAFSDHLIRTVECDGTPWFIAADVCAVLEIQNPRQAIVKLDDDEKGVTSSDTLGGPQEINIVSESGLYALVFKSRKKEARIFRKWVTSEVLPQIRRTGSYNGTHQAYLGLIADQIRLGVSPDLAARCAVRLCPAAVFASGATAAGTGSFITPEDVQELLDVMQPDYSYTSIQLADAMPRDHRLRQGSDPSKRSSVGKIMDRAVAAGRAIRIPGRGKDRTVTYQLPAIASFTTVRDPQDAQVT